MIENNLLLLIITIVVGFSGVSVITLWKEDILKFNSIFKGIVIFLSFTLVISILYSILIFGIYKIFPIILVYFNS